MRLLALLSRFPYPLEKGDKLRAYHQLRQLSAQHEVYLVALSEYAVPDADLQQLTPYCKEIYPIKIDATRRFFNLGKAFFSGLPIQCGYFYNKQIQKQIDEIIQKVQPDWLYCQLFRMAEYVKNKPIKKVLDYQDVFSKGIDRMIPKSAWWKRGVLRAEYRRVVPGTCDYYQFGEYQLQLYADEAGVLQYIAITY